MQSHWGNKLGMLEFEYPGFERFYGRYKYRYSRPVLIIIPVAFVSFGLPLTGTTDWANTVTLLRRKQYSSIIFVEARDDLLFCESCTVINASKENMEY
jgi:hypothetical protein